MVPWLIQMSVSGPMCNHTPSITDRERTSPYYVFLGCSRSRSTSQAFKAFEIESGNRAGSGHITPLHSPSLGPGNVSRSHMPLSPATMLAVAASASPDVGSPVSPASSTSSATTAVDREMPELSLGPAALTLPEDPARSKLQGNVSRNGEFAFPLSSFHYQSR